jgi:hypothetical protein
MRLSASKFKGSKGFGGFSGLFGTGVSPALPTDRRVFCVVDYKNTRDAEMRGVIFTRVPIDPANPPNPFEPWNSDA